MNSGNQIIVGIGLRNYIISSDDSYLEHIKNGFEPDTVDLLRVLANGSRVVLDVGANIGCTAILFGELAETVYAFEPSPTTFQFLEKNVQNSGFKNIYLQNVGLGDQCGRTTLTFSPSNRSGGFVSNQTQASAGHTTENIVIKTLDEVVDSLDLGKIDFIKIDVEGFEGHVLRGAKKALIDNRPIVLLELNHWCLNAFQRTSIPDFFSLLRSIFPILLAVDGSDYLNLHDCSDSYIVMYHHILNMRFPYVLAAFDEHRLGVFKGAYKHQFVS